MIRQYFLKTLCVFLVLGGCQSFSPQRSVDENNTFYSTRYPEIGLSIDPSLTYIGNLKHTKYKQYKNSPGGSSAHYQTFFFGVKAENSHLQRGVIIRTQKLSEGYILPDLFSNTKHILDSGITSFGDQSYQYAVFPKKRPFFDFEENYLFDHGYVLSDKFMAKAFSRREGSNNNYSIEIMYVESLEDFQKGKTRYRDWTRREYLSGEQRQFLKTLGKTCDQCIIVNQKLPKQ